MSNSSDFQDMFGVFADPATTVEVTETDTSVLVKMTRDGQEKQYLIQRDTGAVEARHADSKRYINIDSLLASEEFADLRGLAGTQKRILDGKHASANVLPPELRRNHHPISRDDLLGQLNEHQGIRTRIVLLDGPAGIGKTFFLERLSWERAGGYVKGQQHAPVLHVTSRGRRLFDLTDAIAATTQVVRARFTFEQVPLLVRRGLLVLAIDGFDELVDAEGYKDSWTALRTFVEEIGEGGTVILAGRDTFFSEQQFRDRLQGVKQKYEHFHVHLAPVSREAAVEWLGARGWPSEDLESPRTDELLHEGSYLLRPYFLSVLAGAGGWNQLLDQMSVRRFLVERFLDREAVILEKLSPDLSQTARHELLESILEEVALDMSERESDTVTIEYVALLCEAYFEDMLPARDVGKLTHKAGSIALLEEDAGHQRRLRRFPHSEIQHYFLARGIVEKLASGQLPAVLRRGVLGMDFLEVFVEEFRQESPERARTSIKRLRAFMEHEAAGDRLAPNGASLLLAALIRPDALDDSELSHLQADEATLATATPSVRLSNVSVGRLDVSSADLRDVQFKGCRVGVLLADELTRFGTSLPRVESLRVVHGESPITYDPEEIAKWLQEHSTVPASTTAASGVTEQDGSDLPLMRLLERVCRKNLRQLYIREGGDDFGAYLLADPLWPELEEILEQHGRIERKVKPMGGPAAPLVRITNPHALLKPAPADKAAQAIRREVLQRARQLA